MGDEGEWERMKGDGGRWGGGGGGVGEDEGG